MKRMSSQEFLLSRRAEATRISYRWSLRYSVGNADEFIKLAREDKKKAERQLIDWIIKERDRVAPSTVRAPISALQSLLDYNDVPLNWRKIKSILPKAKKVANDEAPSHEQIRQLLTVCSPREKAAVLIMSSCGMRIGGFEGMKVKHLKIENGIGELKARAGEVLGLDKRIQLTLDISKIPITEDRSPTLQNIKIGAETERRTQLEKDLKLKKEEEKKS